MQSCTEKIALTRVKLQRNKRQHRRSNPLSKKIIFLNLFLIEPNKLLKRLPTYITLESRLDPHYCLNLSISPYLF